MIGAIRSEHRTMGIVAGQATEFAIALQETVALSQSIGVMIDFKSIFGRTIVIDDVEIDLVVRQLLTRLKGIVTPSESTQAEQCHRGLPMALVTDVIAKLCGQLGRIDDIRRVRGNAFFVSLNMFGSGAMTPLAADSVRQFLWERLRCPMQIRMCRNIGVGIVTEQALAAHSSSHSFVVGTVVTGSHSPLPFFGVPGNRQLEQFARRSLIEIGPCVVSRSQNPVHRLLEDIDFHSIDGLLKSSKHV